MKAWITGAGGLIGSHLVRAASECLPAESVRGLTRQQLDLTDFRADEGQFLADSPSLVIHCAALSQSPACQENPALARRLNVDVTAHLAKLSAKIPFIFLSTDLVFDGRAGNYSESATPNPLSVYAELKLEAERVVLANPRHTVVRTSLNGGISPTGDRGFNEQMHLAWKAGRTLSLFTDEFRSPIPAAVTARAIWELVQRDQPGLFHLAGAARLSRWEIGRLLAARWPQLIGQITPASLRDYRGAPRPPDCSLDCAKIQRLLSFRLPGLGEWMAENPREPF